MDEQLLRRIEEARRAGYSDQEISSALGQPIPTAQGRPEIAMTVPMLTAEERARIAQEDAAVQARASSAQSRENVATGVTGAVLYGAPVLGGLGAGALAYKGFQSLRSPAGQNVASGVGNLANAAAERLRGSVPSVPAAPAAPTAPVAPAAVPAAPVAPVAPTAAAPAAPAGLPAQMTAGMRAPVSAAPRIIDTATDMVRKLALEKLLPAARVASPVGTAASILAPSPTGPMVPRSGPLRGSEINPATGTGWTREELAQYEAAQRQRMPR